MSNYKKLTEEQIKELSEDFKEGMRCEIICFKYEISTYMVRKYTKDHRDESMNSRRQLDYEAISKDYIEGMPIEEITKKHYVSCRMIYYIVEKMGLEKRGQPKNKKKIVWNEDKEKILIAMTKNNIPTSVVARELNVTKAAVYRRRNILGIKMSFINSIPRKKVYQIEESDLRCVEKMKN